MSDSDGDYVEHRSSGDDHDTEFHATEFRATEPRARNAGSRRSKGTAALDGRFRPSQRRAPARAAWEGSLQELKARNSAVAEAGRAVDLSRVLEARKRAG
jgi:hypothetical protein